MTRNLIDEYIGKNYNWRLYFEFEDASLAMACACDVALWDGPDSDVPLLIEAIRADLAERSL